MSIVGMYGYWRDSIPPARGEILKLLYAIVLKILSGVLNER
jgi:hypothetical protein